MYSGGTEKLDAGAGGGTTGAAKPTPRMNTGRYLPGISLLENSPGSSSVQRKQYALAGMY